MNENSSADRRVLSSSEQDSVMKEYERLLGKKYDPQTQTLSVETWLEAKMNLGLVGSRRSGASLSRDR